MVSGQLGLCTVGDLAVHTRGVGRSCEHFLLWYNRHMRGRLPNAENARIDSRKLRDHVLNPEHDTGRYKAAFFTQMG